MFEEIGVKKQVFAELEKYVGPDTVLATNTSSLSITEMAADLEHPERVVGFHFFNPVAVMPLLEIVRAEKTDDATLATAFAVAKPLKKGPILIAGRGRVRDEPVAAAVHGRGDGGDRRGHTGRCRGSRDGPARAADDPDHADPVLRAGRRAARAGDG